MKRLLPYAFLLIGITLITGCGRAPSHHEQAEVLREWLDKQSFSTYETFKHKGKTPEYPESPDGFTLGNDNVFAAIGTEPDDLTSLDLLWGDNRTVRPLAKPLTLSLDVRGRGLPRGHRVGPIALKDFPDQTLRRIRHTTITVSESDYLGIRLTCVDFAPTGKNNFLARWFLVENTGKATRTVKMALNLTVPGDWRRLDARSWQLGERFALVATTKLNKRLEQLELSFGTLRPGRRAAAALLLVAADAKNIQSHIEQAQVALPQLPTLLENTKKEWEAWCAKTPLQTGEARIDDLLDSLLCLIRSHIGPNAIHTGSLRYPHNRAWIRDNYWVQLALLKLGRKEEAQRNLDFFHRAWQTSGLASYYEIPSYASTAYGYHGVELPHYLVLMVRETDQLAGIDGRAYWDMVKGCLDEAAVGADGLQPMNGDETWLLAAPVRELDDLLDNSWLLIASAEYGAELAARMGDVERAVRYRALAAHGRAALARFLPDKSKAGIPYAIGYGADGSRDPSLCPEVLARGALLGVVPSTDARITSGLKEAWEKLSYERGLRSHTRSATITGGTPGYVLSVAADGPQNFTPELIARLFKFVSATGCVWEFHDSYDPAWGGEKSRLWDSAVLLMGLVQALFEVDAADGNLKFVPKTGAVAAGASAVVRPFEAERLITQAGPALILHENSPNHAARIARELTRQCNRQFAIAKYAGQPPKDKSAIIVARKAAPTGWRQLGGYWLREWEGPPQLWVMNVGHVFRDTDRLVNDLLSYLPPKRERPLPFPDANYELVGRFGEQPAGEAELTAVSLFHRDAGRLDLAGGEHVIKLGAVTLVATAVPDAERRLVKLTVSALAPRPTSSELSVTLPAGWWLIYARDMTGKWDRVRDPVGQYELSDGRLRLTYSFRPGEERLDLTFELARLAVGGK